MSSSNLLVLIILHYYYGDNSIFSTYDRFLMKLCTYVILLLSFCSQLVSATIYSLPDKDTTLIGELTTTKAKYEDTLLDIARRHGFGVQDIKLVNPSVDTWIPGENQQVNLPSQFLLPMTPQEGLVLNIPEMRLYYFPKTKNGETKQVITYPLGVGREGWGTPYMTTRVIEKKKHPNWYPPESIRKEHEEKGDPLPRVVKAGPDNPLGDYAMRLGRPEYLIHGTNRPFGVGMRVSHGCIRLYPEDIEELFPQVPMHTPVRIINQPYKIGTKDGVIYLEAHPFLTEDKALFENNLDSVSAILDKNKDKNYNIDWELAYAAIKKPIGIPVAIGMMLPETVDSPAAPQEELQPKQIPNKPGIKLRLDPSLNMPS